MSVRTDIRDAVVTRLRAQVTGADVRVAPGRVVPSEPRKSIAVEMGDLAVAPASELGPAPLSRRAMTVELVLHAWSPVTVVTGSEDYTEADDALDTLVGEILAAMESADGLSVLPGLVASCQYAALTVVSAADWTENRTGATLAHCIVAFNVYYQTTSGV